MNMRQRANTLAAIKELIQKELEEADFKMIAESGEMFCRDSNRGFDLPAIMKKIEEILR